jgi:hypothetical protein
MRRKLMDASGAYAQGSSNVVALRIREDEVRQVRA